MNHKFEQALRNFDWKLNGKKNMSRLDIMALRDWLKETAETVRRLVPEKRQ